MPATKEAARARGDDRYVASLAALARKMDLDPSGTYDELLERVAVEIRARGWKVSTVHDAPESDQVAVHAIEKVCTECTRAFKTTSRVRARCRGCIDAGAVRVHAARGGRAICSYGNRSDRAVLLGDPVTCRKCLEQLSKERA